MKKPMSLRLRITLICAVLLAVCCLLLTLTNNLSAAQMADSIQAVPVLPAQEAGVETSLPMMELKVGETVRQAQGVFHLQSLLAMIAILVIGLSLIYQLVGRALAPLDQLTAQIRERTAEDLAQPVEIPASGDEAAELARAFNQMSRRLNQAFLMQKNFSRNAAHEFRTPLAVLKTRIGLFRKKQDFQPAATLAFLRIVEDEVDRLSGMVGSLLELTNLEQAGARERVSVRDLLRAAAEELAPQAEAGQVALQVDAPPDDHLTGNGELLHRAVCNLVGNAVKYSPPGGVVRVAARENAGWMRITVEDRGPGIPEDLRRQIFEPFFRVDDARSRQQGGTGLGLALVRAIAEFHGGTIRAEAGPAGGSRFVLELPGEE